MKFWLLLFFSSSLFYQLGCDKDLQLQPFRSDGCSLFPDRSIITLQDWEQCCFDHDLAYWQGGTEEQRLIADLALKPELCKRVFQTGSLIL